MSTFYISCINNASFWLSKTNLNKRSWGIFGKAWQRCCPGACLGPECNPSFDTTGSKLSFSCRTSIYSLHKTDLFSSPGCLVMVPHQTVGEYFKTPLSLGLGQSVEKYRAVFFVV
jgi:hypothetical protein